MRPQMGILLHKSYLLVLPCFGIFSVLYHSIDALLETEEIPRISRNSRDLLSANNESLVSCIPSGIDAFPKDFFSQEQRRIGGVAVHVLIAFYACLMIGEVCHAYFVPSLNIISEKMKLPPDIAGATFMAIGTSAPELFSSITGAFITGGDIGVGTIIGSAVFNMIFVTGLVGVVLWREELKIDWYPIARDTAAYAITVSTLIWIISDNIVEWWEALILLMIFFMYIIIIYYNQRIENWSRDLIALIQLKCQRNKEVTSLFNGKVYATEITESHKPQRWFERDSYSVEVTASKEVLFQKKQAEDIIANLQSVEAQQGSGSLCASPSQGGFRLLWWVFTYPGRILLFITIPSSKRFFPVTFALSVLWIGVLSYLAVWMVTVIGYTTGIPDSVTGLTILAAGTSVPEVISSIIVAKNGLGNMAISNLIGSNTFDISFCLGAPWLIKTLMNPHKYLLVFSSALTYTTATLLLTLLLFILVFVLSGWVLNRTVGLVFFIIYGVFTALACMYELNVFGPINARTCDE